MSGFIKWLDERFPLMSTWKSHFSEYYVPRNFNFYYFFGSLALVVLANQLVTGIWLTMFYIPTTAEAFHSVETMMREVNYGWLLRYLHSTGASACFIVIYLHLYRGLLYGSYQKPRELVWVLGMVLFVLLLAEAFFGYLLPWGQMSYWGAQVITSLLGAIPYVGDSLVLWVRGDYSVGQATLQRFFALHVVGLPFLLAFFVFLHLTALHKVGSNNPDGVEIRDCLDEQGNPRDGVPMHPYYTVKDLFGVAVFAIPFFVVVFFFPEVGGYFLESSNFSPADPLVTPEHVAPVWYMTPFYAMLRAVPNKAAGVFVMFGAIFMLFLMPWLDKSAVRSMYYKGIYSKIALGCFVVSVLTLGYLGMAPLTLFTLYLARACTAGYFAFFFFMPLYSRYERYTPAPLRIRT